MWAGDREVTPYSVWDSSPHFATAGSSWLRQLKPSERTRRGLTTPPSLTFWVLQSPWKSFLVASDHTHGTPRRITEVCVAILFISCVAQGFCVYSVHKYTKPHFDSGELKSR
jgi:hypothetical protein